MYFKVKPGKSIVDDRGKKKRKKRGGKKGKDPLLFEMWIFCNNPPVRDDSGRAFVTVTSYQEQRSLVEVAIDRVNS
jgi:hypothetical protein